MTKYEWDRKLKRALKDLPREEAKRVFEFYDELFEDKIDEGFREPQIVEQFGDPDKAAAKILADYESYLTHRPDGEERQTEILKTGAEGVRPESERIIAEENAAAANDGAADYNRQSGSKPYGEQRAEREFQTESDEGVARPTVEERITSGVNQAVGELTAMVGEIGRQAGKLAAGAVGALTGAAPRYRSESGSEESKEFAAAAVDWLNTDYEELSETADVKYMSVRRLKLDIAETDVVIIRGEKFSLRYRDDRNTRYAFETARDTLVVKEKYARRFPFFHNKPKAMIIELPTLDEVNFNSVKRGCLIKNLRVRRATLKSVNGSLMLGGCGNDYISISTTSGDVRLSDGSVDSLTLTTTSGDVVMKAMDVTDAAVISTSGDVELTGVRSVGKKLLLKTISGDLIGKKLKMAGGEFKTISGDVRLKVDGKAENFSVTVDTVTGDVNCPKNTSGANKLAVHTISGDVEVSFLQQ